MFITIQNTNLTPRHPKMASLVRDSGNHHHPLPTATVTQCLPSHNGHHHIEPPTTITHCHQPPSLDHYRATQWRKRKGNHDSGGRDEEMTNQTNRGWDSRRRRRSGDGGKGAASGEGLRRIKVGEICGG